MEKWVEITETGITYFKSASHDRAQGFFPRNSIFEVYPAKQPDKIEQLLMKVRNLSKREEERNMMRHMFEIVVSMETANDLQATVSPRK